MLPRVLKPADELGHLLSHLLGYQVELTHEVPLGDASMEYLDEFFSELVEIGELPTHCEYKLDA